MFDPAKHILKIEQANEDMDQALAKCHIKAKRVPKNSKRKLKRYIIPLVYATITKIIIIVNHNI